LSPPLAALAGFAPYEKNHGTQTFEKEKSYAVILEFVNTLDAVNVGHTEGKDSVKEKPSGFLFHVERSG
ncbi:MAG: hypothetical protein IKL27_05660, partial [Oscillospiraceae bacterium]|nr:hypothetical protein [Oscillospiraceae bacterium]